MATLRCQEENHPLPPPWGRRSTNQSENGERERVRPLPKSARRESECENCLAAEAGLRKVKFIYKLILHGGQTLPVFSGG